MKVEMSLMNRSLQDVGAEARRAEALGYDGVTTGETSADPFFKLVLAAEHTERVTLGTSVLIAFPRSPMVVAYQAWDLQAFSHGRLNLGLGTQVGAHIRRRFSGTWDSPGPRLREYIGALRAIWECWRDGVKLNFRGDFYQFTLMTPYFTPAGIEHSHIPVYISAINPYNCRLAGELCDGIRMHGFNTPKYAQQVIIPNLEEGARKAGRTLEEIDIVGTGFTITGPDEQSLEAKFPAVKKQIAFYASTPAYRPVMDSHGWVEEHQRPWRNEPANLDLASQFASPTDCDLFNVLAVPLVARDETLGVISVYSLKGADYTEQHLRLLNIVADHAATALLNARRFERNHELGHSLIEGH